MGSRLGVDLPGGEQDQQDRNDASAHAHRLSRGLPFIMQHEAGEGKAV
jgi:hypothetical protein